ncbi:acyl-CoA dehydrogenase family protein [Aestuariivirga sp.]|uniref:acyl-CoA dehydrogenase family protein n=1 Tax=Aestuariivirga sp. TaxID=2650926 RepID=UPI0035940C91
MIAGDTGFAASETSARASALKTRADAAAAVALKHAADVDASGRYPAEAMAMLKEQRLMGIMVPAELGGEGATMSDAAEVCYTLGRACASTGMIYAMHLVKVACIVNHGMGVDWQESVLKRLLSEQLLFASSTTEGMGGGNVRSSAAPIMQEADGSISLTRNASVISYGEYADGLVTTARRSEGADASDQVLAVFMKEDYEMSLTGGWNTLGMRGTCSTGFMLKARGLPEQVLPVAYDRIHSQTMTPAAHLLWSSVWAGIASAALQKAQLFVRKAMRGSNGQTPPAASRLGEAHTKMRLLRGTLASALARYERGHEDQRAWGSIDYQTALAMTKVDVSELAVDTVMACYRTCGLAGYRNDGDVSIGRHLRDILSSPIMINNDRITASMAGAMMMSGIPNTIQN